MIDSISLIKNLNRNTNARYKLTEEGLIDVIGTVDLDEKINERLPVRFGKVSGSFFCTSNLLTTLDGSPIHVGGTFDCSNNILNHLKGGPKYVNRDFICNNNCLRTLDECPNIVNGNFYCEYNYLEHITHLLGCKIGGDIYAAKYLLEKFKEVKNYEFEF